MFGEVFDDVLNEVLDEVFDEVLADLILLLSGSAELADVDLRLLDVVRGDTFLLEERRLTSLLSLLRSFLTAAKREPVSDSETR